LVGQLQKLILGGNTIIATLEKTCFSGRSMQVTDYSRSNALASSRL